MRYLAFDLGGKRTGVAAGDDTLGLVQPVETVEVPPGDRLLAALVRIVEDHAPDALVVGLPLNMDGTEGPPAKAARAFAERLAAATARPVRLQDERLTSFAAERHLDRSGRTHREKKALRDALAAAEILRDFLAAGPSREPPEEA